MKLYEIDNPSRGTLKLSLCIKKGRRIILIPLGSQIIKTGSRIPHIKISNIEYKYCAACKNWKSLNCFVKQKNNPDGLKEKCKDCDNKQRRKRYAKSKGFVWKNSIIIYKQVFFI